LKKIILIIGMCILFASFSLGAITDGLVGHWNTNDGSAPLVDTLLVLNTTTTNGAPTYGNAGVISTSVYGDATDDYFRVANNAKYAFGTGNLSICMWMKPNANSTNYRTFGNDKYAGGAYQGFTISRDGSNKVLFFTRNNGAAGDNYCTGNINVYGGVWSYICGVRDGTTNRVYVNGVSDVNCTVAQPIVDVTTTVGLKIWAFDEMPTTAKYGGYLDEIGLWNKSLTQAEITTLYNGGTGVTYPFLLDQYLIKGNLTYSGNAVNNASVLLINLSTNTIISNSISNSTGGYMFSNLNLVNNTQYLISSYFSNSSVYLTKTGFATTTDLNTVLNLAMDNNGIVQNNVANIDFNQITSSCTCPTINTNWSITLSDNCNIITNCDIGTGIMTFTGSGVLTITNVSVWASGKMPALNSSQIIYIPNGTGKIGWRT
jgi:hypothetical protein